MESYILAAAADFVSVIAGLSRVVVGESVHVLVPGDALTFWPREPHVGGLFAN